jgi:hypothetical protein
MLRALEREKEVADNCELAYTCQERNTCTVLHVVSSL